MKTSIQNKSNPFSVFDSISLGILFTDSTLKISYTNKFFLELSKLTEKELLHKKISFLQFYSTDSKSNKLDFNTCFCGRKAKIAKTAYLHDKENNRHLVFINAGFSESTGQKGLMIIITDISKEISCTNDTLAPFLFREKAPLKKIVGKDPKILELYRLIELSADSTANVMISGESGTGKELVASAIHYLSDRKDKPFIKVNCSSLTETLLESELFGHVKGSFTGAYKDKVGKFEAASGGSIFLDEIGDISSIIQVKLLRVIQEKTIQRVGDNKEIKTNIRIIAATNKNLRELVNKGVFREDLFYRLHVFPITTPTLRERKTDIPLLTDYFIKKFNLETGKQIRGIKEDAFRVLMAHCWPGNVRELENSIEHAFVVCSKNQIEVNDLPQDLRDTTILDSLCKKNPREVIHLKNNANSTNENSSSTFKRKFISADTMQKILENNNFSKSETARQLGISRVALWKRLKILGID